MNARTQLQAWSYGVLEAATLVAVASVPVLVNFYAFRVFEQSKAAVVTALALLAALAGIVALVEGASIALIRREVRRPLVAGAVALWIATALATVTSIAPTASFLGSLDRAQGLVALTAVLVFFFGVGAFAGEPRRRARLVAALVAASVPVALVGLAQASGLAMVQGTVESAERVFGTLSNPIFLGAYLMLVLPIAVARAGAAWRDGSLVRLAGWAAVGIVQVAALLATASRGPLLGLLAGLGIMALAWSARRGRGVALSVAGIGLVALLALGVLAMPGGVSTALRDAPVVGRLAQISETAVGSQAARIRIWTSASRVVEGEGARLVTGYGPETLRYTILPVSEPNMGGRAQADRLVDRAHNVLLDALTMTGLLGAAALLFVYGAWLAACVGALGLVRSASDRRLLAALLVVGTLVGLATWFAPDLRVASAALGMLGMIGGLALYVLVAALRSAGSGLEWQAPVPHAGLAIGLLGAGTAAVVEGAFGIQTVVTQLVFWTLAGLVVAVAREAEGPEAPATAADGGARVERAESAPGVVTISWSPGGAALGLAMGAGLGMLLYTFVLHGLAMPPDAGPVLLAVVVLGWLAAVLAASDAGESAATAGLTAAVALVVYAGLRALILALTSDPAALFAGTVVWLLVLALVAGVWLRGRAGKAVSSGGPAVIAYPLLAIGAVAAIVVLSVLPVQADIRFQAAVAQFNAALAADDPAALQTAEASYAAATAANPREATYRSRWAELYTLVGVATNDPATAAPWFSRAQAEAARAEELEPRMPYHVYNRGHLQLVFAQMQPADQRVTAAANAETALQQAFDMAPADPAIANELALARLLQGNAEGAVSLLEYVRDQLDPDDPATWQLLANAYAAAGRAEDAEAAVQHITDMGAISPQTFVALGDLAREREDLAAAISWYERAVNAGPVGWAVLYNFGLLYRDAGNRDKAMEMLGAALQQAPTEEERTLVQSAMESVLLGGEIVQP